MNLTESKILVTGGASGMGREFVLSLARDGADVAFCDLSEEGIEPDWRYLGLVATAIQQYRQPEQDRDAKGRMPPAARQILVQLRRDAVALARDKESQEALLGARKARHIGIGRDVGAVSLVTVVGNIQPDLM